MVESLNPSSMILMVAEDHQVPLLQVPATAGFGVFDVGAAETVWSSETIDKVLQRRHQHGHLHPGERT